MSLFPDHLNKKWEARIEIQEEDPEIVFEKYFNALCNFQSNYNFFEFLAEDYDHAHLNALNCLEYGFDMEEIPPRKIRDWILSATECMYALLGQYVERKGKEFRDEDKNLELRIRRHLETLGSEWKYISKKLEPLQYFSRNPVSHPPKGRQLKKSRAISKEALKHKGEYVVVHMESLKNIRKDFPNYEREKEI